MGAEGVRVVNGRSLPYGTSSPAFAVEEILRSALQLDASASTEQARAALDERLTEIGTAIDPQVLATFLGFGGQMLARNTSTTAIGAQSAAGQASVVLEAAASVL